MYVDVGPFVVDIGNTDSATLHALNVLGDVLAALPSVARALDTIDCTGIEIPDEHYKVALSAAVLSSERPRRCDAVEKAQHHVFAESLQRLRKQGIDIPRQPWE